MFPRPIPRNEEDGSPGGGSSPPPAPAPEPPAAHQGAEQTVAISPTQLAQMIGQAVAQQVSGLKDSFFAEERRSGRLPKKPDKTPTQTPHRRTPRVAEPAGVSRDDVATMFAQESALQSYAMTGEQETAIRQTIAAVNPSDFNGWLSGFAKTMGIGLKSATPNPTPNNAQHAAAPQPKPAGQNISDRGPASAGSVRDHDTVAATRPLELNSSDIDQMRAKHGPEKANEMIRNSVLAHLRGIRLRPDRKR